MILGKLRSFEEQRGRDATDKVAQERQRRKDAKLSYMMWADSKDREAVTMTLLIWQATY